MSTWCYFYHRVWLEVVDADAARRFNVIILFLYFAKLISFEQLAYLFKLHLFTNIPKPLLFFGTLHNSPTCDCWAVAGASFYLLGQLRWLELSRVVADSSSN